MEGDVTGDEHAAARQSAADLVERVRRTLGVDVASAAVVDPDGHYPMTAHAGAESAAYRTLSIERGAGLGGLVLDLERPVRLRDYATSDRISAEYRNQVDAEGLHALACVPVISQGGTLLLLYAGSRGDDALPDRALGRLEGLAEVAAAELDHLAAAQQERARLAAELHDSVAQVLFAIAAGAEAGPTSPEEVAATLAEIRELAATGKADLRRTFASLTAAPSDSTPITADAAADRPIPGLAERLVRVAAEVGTECGVQVRFVGGGPGCELTSPPIRDLFADALREAIRNARRHAASGQLLARLSRDGDQLVLTAQSPYLAGPSVPSLHVPLGSGVDLLDRRARTFAGNVTLTALTDDPESPLVVQRIRVPVPVSPEVDP